MRLSQQHQSITTTSISQFTEPHRNHPIAIGDHIVYSQVDVVYAESVRTDGSLGDKSPYKVFDAITVYNPSGKNPRTYQNAMLIPVHNEKPCFVAVVTGTLEALEAAKFSKDTFKPKRSKKPKPSITG